MEIFWTNIEVNFNESLSIYSDKDVTENTRVNGFFQEIGCSANNEEECKQLILDYLEKTNWFDLSKADIKFTRIGEIYPEDVEQEIYNDVDINNSLISSPQIKGIWYLSGRAYFYE